MSDLRDIVRHIFRRFGRPDQSPPSAGSDANVEAIDKRLTTVEQQVRENTARLSILRKQGNPWGIGREP